MEEKIGEKEYGAGREMWGDWERAGKREWSMDMTRCFVYVYGISKSLIKRGKEVENTKM